MTENDVQETELTEGSGETEEITITATWETTHHVTVPKGWRPGATLSDFPPHVLEEMRSDDPSAMLTDWQ